VSYTAQEGREQILSEIEDAAEQLGIALAELGEAYELLDEHTADTMEQTLFRPVQAAYGQLKRTHSAFAARHGFADVEFASPPPGHPTNPHATIERAADAVQSADDALASLQDSMLPVEVGDRELREGLSGARTAIGSFPVRYAELTRTLGR
jgi:hypothetical protein